MSKMPGLDFYACTTCWLFQFCNFLGFSFVNICLYLFLYSLFYLYSLLRRVTNFHKLLVPSICIYPSCLHTSPPPSQFPQTTCMYLLLEYSPLRKLHLYYLTSFTSQSSQGAIRKCHRLVAYIQKSIAHSSGGREIQEKGTESASGKVPLPSYQMAVFSLYPSMVEKTRDLTPLF